MVRFLDHKKRQDAVLKLIIKTYIDEGHPTSSEHLREMFQLPFSSATLRNVMAELESLGYLSHLHTSSGRVPTPLGFRYYINFLMEEVGGEEEVESFFPSKKVDEDWVLGELLEESSKAISNLTHYAGLGFCSDETDKLFLCGTRFIVQEPEFEDITTLRSIFTLLEENMGQVRDCLEEKSTEGVQVFIGDEIGLQEINSCSLVFSPLCSAGRRRAFLGVLGPVRMNYSLAISRLRMLKTYLEESCLGHV